METHKSHQRRANEGWFARYTPAHATGIDIGCQHDPIQNGFRQWDYIFGDGDCTLMEGIGDNSHYTVYASHVLEHLEDPICAIRNWYRILMPGGHLIIVVPHRNLYEKRRTLPSRWNAEHKTFWLPFESEPPATFSLYGVIRQALAGADIVMIRILDDNYQANGDDHPTGEYSIEAIVRKPLTVRGVGARGHEADCHQHESRDS